MALIFELSSYSISITNSSKLELKLNYNINRIWKFIKLFNQGSAVGIRELPVWLRIGAFYGVVRRAKK